MPKSKSSKASAAHKKDTPISAPAKKPSKAKDEIDSIFASKPLASVAPAPKKASAKHSKAPPSAASTKAVETIFDPSQSIAAKAVAQRKPAASKSKEQIEEEASFKDSRGTRKTTEDGLPIYSVEELKIGLGGDTDDCPFDCECCY